MDFYVLFIDQMPDSLADENDTGDVRGFVDQFDFEEQWPEYLHLVPVPVRPIDQKKLAHEKRVAIREIEQYADSYQIRLLGANTSQREARLAQNLAAAKRIIADNYGANVEQKNADYLSMQSQAEAQALKTNEAEMSVSDFAEWIAVWEPKTTMIAGLIEAFLVKGRAGINALTDPAQISPFLSQLSKSAEAKFSELTS